jgi:hypothetical protein
VVARAVGCVLSEVHAEKEETYEHWTYNNCVFCDMGNEGEENAEYQEWDP